MSKGLQQYYDYIDNNIEAPCQRYGYKRDKIKKVCNIKMSDKEIEDTMTKYVDSDSYQEDLDVFFKKNTKSNITTTLTRTLELLVTVTVINAKTEQKFV